MEGCTPLYIAANDGHESVVKQLLAARCKMDLREGRPYCAAMGSATGARRNGHADTEHKAGQRGGREAAQGGESAERGRGEAAGDTRVPPNSANASAYVCASGFCQRVSRVCQRVSFCQRGILLSTGQWSQKLRGFGVGRQAEAGGSQRLAC